MSTTAAPHIGHRYILRDKIGEGSFGIVYRAQDHLTGDIIALKRMTTSTDQLLFASLGHESRLNLALAREFRILASLRHPHIISVLDYGFDQDRNPYFTMELLENSNTILEAGEGKSVEFQIGLLIELLQALIYLHRRAVLHRDLKPANVLVTGQGQVKVLDFGLSTTLERAKGIAGTLIYMAPEILRQQPVSRASDLFAVGVVAYQLLAGHYPFNTKSPNQLISSLLYQTPDFSPIGNTALEDVLMTCLEKDPAARYGDADELIQVLRQAIQRPPPQESIAIRESYLQAARFVGRDTELTQLRTALTDAQASKGSLWLVGGESGIGKSRLVDELHTHALVEGALVLRGQAIEGGGLPYQLWRDPLRRLALHTQLNDLEAGILKELVPDIGNLMGRDVPDAPELTGVAGQQRLALTINEVFRRQTQPVVLLLEDLQWTTESLFPIKELTRIVGEIALLIIGNYRNDERANLPDELPGVQHIMLE